MVSPPTIPILTLGRHRPIGQTIAGILAPHGFSVNGILIIDTYASKELAAALRVLEPRPQALLVGGGFTDEEAEQAKLVFDEYKKDVELERGTVVRVGQGVLDKVGREGVGKWIVGELETFFRIG